MFPVSAGFLTSCSTCIKAEGPAFSQSTEYAGVKGKVKHLTGGVGLASSESLMRSSWGPSPHLSPLSSNSRILGIQSVCTSMRFLLLVCTQVTRQTIHLHGNSELNRHSESPPPDSQEPSPPSLLAFPHRRIHVAAGNKILSRRFPQQSHTALPSSSAFQ